MMPNTHNNRQEKSCLTAVGNPTTAKNEAKTTKDGLVLFAALAQRNGHYKNTLLL